VQHIFFHYGGKEYIIHETLKVDEIKTIVSMEKERNRKLDPLDKKSVKRCFEDTDKMVASILRKPFHMTDDQIMEIDEVNRRNLAYSFIQFTMAANDFQPKCNLAIVIELCEYLVKDAFEPLV
jgi:hypothetical protein